VCGARVSVDVTCGSPPFTPGWFENRGEHWQVREAVGAFSHAIA